MGKGLETGSAFLKEVLGKITDPEQRAAAEKLMANPTFVTEVGNGVEGQTEITRRLNELSAKAKDLDTRAGELKTTEDSLTQWQQQLTDWRTVNNDTLELGKKARELKWDGKTPGSGAPAVPTATSTTPAVTEETIRTALQEHTANLLGYDADKSELTKRHFDNFKELLDIRPLLQHPKIREIGLKGVYEDVFKKQIEDKATADAAAKEAAIRADERAKTLATTQTMPYPTPSGVSSGSPLDALKAPDGGGPLVDQAVLEYQRLQTTRNGAPA